MSTPINDRQGGRNTLAQGIIVLAVCIGGYMALVDGPRKKLVAAQSQLAIIAAQLKDADSLRDQVAVLTATREKARADAKVIAHAGRLAREERDLFAAIMALADGNKITVESMAPARIGPGKGAAQHHANDDKDQAHDFAVAYGMTITGEYTAIANLLRGLRTTLGHSVVRSVRLVPLTSEAGTLIRASIETEHYSFDAAPAPAPADGVRTAGAPEAK